MYNEYFVPYPTIETDRLIIRMVKKRDAEDLFELCRRPETSQFSLWSPHESLSETKDFISYQLSRYRKRECMFFVVFGIRSDSGLFIFTVLYSKTHKAFK